jgi:hypothetical protein
MAKQHYFLPSGATRLVHPVRLGAGVGSANNLTTADEGKLIKLVGESRYDLCVAGDAIEGLIYAVEPATSGGYSVGGRVNEGQAFAIADGLQATPGTGVLAVGDYVVAGSITAKGTRLTSFPKVCKATSQTPGIHAWRVMSLTAVGTGAVGTQVVIERV